MYGVVNIPLIPMRAEPLHKSEMVSQILFGETFIALEFQKDWVFIEGDSDNYKGWIPRSSFKPLIRTKYNEFKSSKTSYITSPFASVLNKKRDTYMILPFGSVVRNLSKADKTFEHFKMIEGKASHEGLSIKEMIKLSKQWINVPYLWGGRTFMGVDCSGFIQNLMRLCGVMLPRDASLQVTTGNEIPFLQETMPGDLAFFGNTEGVITHVGMIIEPGKIIHASGRVRIDKIDQHGIYNPEIGDYSHVLRIIKRVLN